MYKLTNPEDMLASLCANITMIKSSDSTDGSALAIMRAEREELESQIYELEAARHSKSVAKLMEPEISMMDYSVERVDGISKLANGVLQSVYEQVLGRF